MLRKLIIVEDEFLISNEIRVIVTRLGYAVMAIAKSADEAIAAIKTEKPDLALLDIRIIGDTNGIELAHILNEKYAIPHLFITSYSDDDIVAQMNETQPLGYILKPFDERDIRVALQMASSGLDIKEKIENKRMPVAPSGYDTQLIGESDWLKELIKKAQLVAHTDVTVLIEGETGVGKELVMKTLVANSNRADGPLVKVNCAALPQELIESTLFGHEKGSFTGATERRIGKFELANGGTIFLDEIGELPLSSQSKLLRCLQEKEIETVGGSIQKKIDVRVIAATNKDLPKCVSEGTFRADLFFRLSVFPLKVVPLRERKEDILPIALHFIETASKRFERSNIALSKKSKHNLIAYSWPGNVRELQHILERAILLSEGNVLEIDLAHEELSTAQENNGFKQRSLEEIEREQIIETLKFCKGKIRGEDGAAFILKLHPNTLDFKIKKLGINKSTLFK